MAVIGGFGGNIKHQVSHFNVEITSEIPPSTAVDDWKTCMNRSIGKPLR